MSGERRREGVSGERRREGVSGERKREGIFLVELVDRQGIIRRGYFKQDRTIDRASA